MKYSELSRNRQLLVQSMSQLGYGQIRRLFISNGDPLNDPPPRICRRRRLKGSVVVDLPKYTKDCLLKEQVVNLSLELDKLGNGVITIDVRDGLPCDIIYEQ